RTVMVSSHILSELSEFCTSVGIMAQGRMMVSGRIEALAAMGEARYAADVLSEHALAERLLAADERVAAVRWSGSTIEFSLKGGPEAASELLARLVEAGVRVAAFARRREDLEELFLSVSRGND